MWIKRTEAEMAELRDKQRRSRLRFSVAAVVVVLLVSTCLFSWQEDYYKGVTFVPVNELASRLPMGAFAGVLIAFVLYRYEPYKRQVMICPKCETTKFDDNVSQCSCGGHFENADTMKHVD